MPMGHPLSIYLLASLSSIYSKCLPGTVLGSKKRGTAKLFPWTHHRRDHRHLLWCWDPFAKEVTCEATGSLEATP